MYSIYKACKNHFRYLTGYYSLIENAQKSKINVLGIETKLPYHYIVIQKYVGLCEFYWSGMWYQLWGIYDKINYSFYINIWLYFILTDWNTCTKVMLKGAVVCYCGGREIGGRAWRGFSELCSLEMGCWCFFMMFKSLKWIFSM